MRLQSLFGKIALAISLAAGLSGAVHAAPSKPSPDTPVLVVEDKTSESSCLVWAETPENAYPCPAGTLIGVRKTTYAEVANLKHAHYVVLTNSNSSMSEQATEYSQSQQAAQKLHDQLAVPASTQATCTSGYFNQSGSYSFQGRSVQFEVYYSRQSDCFISNISDRTKCSSCGAVWVSTQIDYNIYNRNYFLTGNWTNGGGLTGVATQAGKQYVHSSRTDLSYTQYYYYTSFKSN